MLKYLMTENYDADTSEASFIDNSDVPGSAARSPLSFPLKAWWAIIKRVWAMNDFHNLALLAAGVAFYTFLAFVPMIAAVVLLYGLLRDPNAVIESMSQIEQFVPPEVATVLQDQLLAIVTTNAEIQGIGLILALAVAIFGAMRASSAMMKALNIIYEEHESRNIAQFYWVSATITLGMAGVGIVGILSASFFGYVQIVLTDYMGPTAIFVIKFATWAVAGMLVSFTFAIFFRYAPDRRGAKWRWLTLGSIVSTLLWIGATFGFGLYAANISNYNATYGSLAAVVIFQMWLFLSAYAVLIGAEINAETERQTMQDSTIGKDRPIGERGAVMADNVALDQASVAILEKKKRRKAERLARKVS